MQKRNSHSLLREVGVNSLTHNIHTQLFYRLLELSHISLLYCKPIFAKGRWAEHLCPFPALHQTHKVPRSHSSSWELTTVYCSQRFMSSKRAVVVEEAGLMVPQHPSWEWKLNISLPCTDFPSCSRELNQQPPLSHWLEGRLVKIKSAANDTVSLFFLHFIKQHDSNDPAIGNKFVSVQGSESFCNTPQPTALWLCQCLCEMSVDKNVTVCETNQAELLLTMFRESVPLWSPPTFWVGKFQSGGRERKSHMGKSAEKLWWNFLCGHFPTISWPQYFSLKVVC